MILQRTVVWIVVKPKPSLHPERVDTIVYTEKGTVHCICPATGEQRAALSRCAPLWGQ